MYDGRGWPQNHLSRCSLSTKFFQQVNNRKPLRVFLNIISRISIGCFSTLTAFYQDILGVSSQKKKTVSKSCIFTIYLVNATSIRDL